MSTGELPVRSALMIAFGELFFSQASPAGVAPSLRLGDITQLRAPSLRSRFCERGFDAALPLRRGLPVGSKGTIADLYTSRVAA